MIELLKDGIYIRYWLAVVASFLGDAIAKVTLIYLAATMTGAPVVLISLVIIAQLLPTGALGAFVGPLADRAPPRLLLVGSDLARVLIVLAMIPARHSLWLLLLILLEGVGNAFFQTARISAIPKFVGNHSIPSAVALFQSTNNTINLLGPALGGVLIAIGSVPAVLVIDAGTFIVSALLLGSLAVLREVPPVGRGVREPYWQALRTGLHGVMQVPALRFLAVLMVPVMLVVGLFNTNLNSQLLTVFQLSPLRYGLAQAMVGGGAVVAALIGPMLVRRYSSNTLLVGSVALFGLTLVALAPAEWLRGGLGIAVIGLWCLLAGLGSGLFQVPVANAMLRELPEELRGRGVGLMSTVMTNFMIIGVAVGGLMAELTGVATSIIVAGVALVAVSVFAIPALRPAQPKVSS